MKTLFVFLITRLEYLEKVSKMKSIFIITFLVILTIFIALVIGPKLWKRFKSFLNSISEVIIIFYDSSNVDYDNCFSDSVIGCHKPSSSISFCSVLSASIKEANNYFKRNHEEPVNETTITDGDGNSFRIDDEGIIKEIKN
jgi:hypothetical protein